MRVSLPPPLAVEVPRPALDARLDAAAQHRLTIVAAGPGWGKTSVVAGWLRRTEGRRVGATTWLTLDARDDVPVMFWDVVLQAVAHSGAVPTGHPLSSVTTAGGVSDEVLLSLFRGLARLPEPLLLVLDDFHVIENPAILAAIAELVAHETPVHLMLLTRVDPPLPLHRLRLSGQLVEIRAVDLAFDAAAVSSLAGLAEGLHLTPEQVEAILARTEGWPAGVRLATMYIARERDDPELRSFTGTNQSVAEFLMAEVLEQHDAATNDFLMRTSVAEQLTGDLADAIVPGGSGLARLESLDRANHFVTSVDTERTTYRYHPLLRDLLLHRLKRDDPEGYRAAHHAAARWLVAKGDPVAALRHAAASEDWTLVGEVFFEASPSLVGDRRFTVARHLQAIPFDSLPSTPALELCAAGVDLVSGHLAGMAVHVEAARRLAAEAPVPPVAEAVMEIIAGAAGRVTGDVERVIDRSTAALAQVARMSPGPAAEGLRTIATTQRAVGFLLTGDIPSAFEGFTSTVNSTDPGDVALTVFAARAYRSWCLIIMGRVEEGEAAAREVLHDASLRGWTSLLQVRPAHLAMATAHLLRGDGPDAYRAVSAGLAAEVGGVELWVVVALRLTHASIAVTRNRPRAALASLDKALSVAGDLPVPPALVDSMSRAKADVALLTRDPTGTVPPDGDEPEHPTATWWSSRARRDLVFGDLDSAADAARRVPQPSESDELVDVLAAVEARLVLALVADRRRRPQEAADHIRSALEHARGQRLVWPFLDTEPDRVSAILGRLAKAGLSQSDAFFGGVLAKLTSQEPVAREPDPIIDPLTERELAVLTELPTMKTNAEIAAEFYVSPNTVKSQLQHLFRKLAVSNRRDAVRRGRELGLIA